VNKEKERVLSNYLSKWEDRYTAGWHDGWDEKGKQLGAIEGEAWSNHARRGIKRTRRDKKEREG